MSVTDEYYEKVIEDWWEIGGYARQLKKLLSKAKVEAKRSPLLYEADEDKVLELLERGTDALEPYLLENGREKENLKRNHPPASGPEFASRMGLIREAIEGPLELYLTSDDETVPILRRAERELNKLQKKIKETRESYSKRDFENWLRRTASREENAMSDKKTLKTARRKVKAAKNQLIRVAYNNPELRSDLLPVIKKAEQLSDVDIDEGEMHELLGVDENKDMSEEYSPSQLVDELVDVTGDEKEAAGMINWTANMNPDSDFWQAAQDHLAETDYPE